MRKALEAKVGYEGKDRGKERKASHDKSSVSLDDPKGTAFGRLCIVLLLRGYSHATESHASGFQSS
jgi:hypothetical protein